MAYSDPSAQAKPKLNSGGTCRVTYSLNRTVVHFPPETKSRTYLVSAIQRAVGANRRLRQWDSCVAATRTLDVGATSNGKLPDVGSPNSGRQPKLTSAVHSKRTLLGWHAVP